MSDKDDEGPLGAALAAWDQLFEERELGAGHWSAADLHALVIATMKRDTQLICYECGHPHLDGAEMEAAIRQGGRWVHRFSGTDDVRYCRAGPIHDLIAQMEKARQ